MAICDDPNRKTKTGASTFGACPFNRFGIAGNALVLSCECN